MSVHLFFLHTTAKIIPLGKEYMCFHIDGKYFQAANCTKSMIMNKVIDYVFSIDKFEQQCVVLKSLLQTICIKDDMKTIGIDQSLSNSALFYCIYLQNIKKLFQHAGKCDNQQQLKDILEAAVVSTPEGFIDNSPRSPMTPTPVNKPSAKKSLCLFTNILHVIKKLISVKLGLINQSARRLKQ